MNDNIEEIVIDGNEKFEFIDYILSLKNIKDIEFRYCKITSEELIKLSEYKEYDRIAFAKCDIEDVNLQEYVKNGIAVKR